MRTEKSFYIVILIAVSLFSSCKKYLDKKPDPAQVIPTTVADAQLILDNTREINLYPIFDMGEWSSDNYYCSCKPYIEAVVTAQTCALTVPVMLWSSKVSGSSYFFHPG